ncbi:uncharacterized protein PV07_08625 [Cladophialophora immunda]|uniref:Uncharacterized protein n=1 Tax=Cladophialophora immunda TaxID=569365 RepID=A0A0D2C2I7_9EURO|nr:uncharacterized protein PV07_08625 [Cladophialophora immunda]KIW25453.1 hypothetical protein PV07_08625 [Cladophialophora immunda]OQV10147.1 hypothetical protein CLAIMM_14186 isoform 1 [Cladophialophora immunda]OQV10148.1 hypothetical protein CLAIMM_14186 isoform 2 [Cladophialophora immunda]
MQNLPSPAEEQPPYDRVKAYLEDFKLHCEGRRTAVARDFDQLFRCRISPGDWLKVQRDLHIYDLDESPGRFSYETRCKFSYHASTSTLIIECAAPSAMHEVAVGFIEGCFRSVTDPTTVGFVRNEDYELKGEGPDPTKKADLALDEFTHGGHKYRWVLEVGFSETYDELLEDIQTWLTRSGGDIVHGVLMKITEEPPYRCPLPGVSDEELERRGLKSHDDISEDDFVMEGEYGPVSYQGDRWVGEIKEVFWEVWRLDPETRQLRLVAQREVIVPKTSSSSQIQLDEFLTTAPANVQASLDWDLFRLLLKRKIPSLGLKRYQTWIRTRKRRDGDDRRTDPDYV